MTCPFDRSYFPCSFLCGGSTAVFVYGYCFYYFIGRSSMSGFMQVRVLGQIMFDQV